jgi:hypothetical protein
VPVGRLEAVPSLWAQEGPVQGQGMLCCSQAPPAGLQSCRGGAGGIGRGRVDGGSFLRSVGPLRCGTPGVTVRHRGRVWVFWVELGLEGVP